MPTHPLIERILEDESLTADLDETDASTLVRALVKHAESIVPRADAERQVSQLRRYGRGIGRIVSCFREDGASHARSLAIQQGYPWPTAPIETSTELVNWLIDHIPSTK